MRIYSYLEEMQSDLFIGNLEEMERKYYDLCSQLAGNSMANRVQKINLDEYQKELERGITEALEVAECNFAKAIYFEYDLDNEWHSHFFICDQYNQLEDQDDDWACDWSDYLEGPTLPEFAEIYSENGFDTTEIAMGITLYLVARTVVAFAKACRKVESKVPICIGFHDQDPIMRVGIK